MRSNIGDRIRNIRERRNLTQEDLADLSGVHRVTIAKYEAGRIEPKSKSLQKLASALEVSVDEIVNDNSYLRSTASVSTKIPVLGTIPAGIPLEAIEDIIDWEEIPAEWTRGGKEYFALKIRGDSMYPRYEDGDVIILRRTNEFLHNKDSVVMVNSDEATFKRIRVVGDGIMLQPINPDYNTVVYSFDAVERLPVRVLGVVVELRRRME